MVTNEVGLKRFVRSKFLSHEPVHIVVEVLRANASMPVIQRRFHRSMAVIHGVEMPGSAPPFTSTAIDDFV